ncbi:MAG: hypothetical protein KatS3mg101_1030 [Patescibacteria group bacterium]|nr:MAG: hypothetical protein KatS3mg101_1030 [Patescibacteria group bacterium]
MIIQHIQKNKEFLKKFPEFKEQFYKYIREENKISDDDYIPPDIPHHEWNKLSTLEKLEIKEEIIKKSKKKFIVKIKKKVLPILKKRFQKMTTKELAKEKSYILSTGALTSWLFWQPIMLILLDLIWNTWLEVSRREKARKAGLVNAKKKQR